MTVRVEGPSVYALEAFENVHFDGDGDGALFTQCKFQNCDLSRMGGAAFYFNVMADCETPPEWDDLVVASINLRAGGARSGE